ncbi:hypothetical protein ACET3Z_012904 [Daucus carota]
MSMGFPLSVCSSQPRALHADNLSVPQKMEINSWYRSIYMQFNTLYMVPEMGLNLKMVSAPVQGLSERAPSISAPASGVSLSHSINMADSEERPIPFRAAHETRPSSRKDGPTAKIGRPKVTITGDVLERRRLSKRRQNARRTIQQGWNAKLACSPGAPPTGILNVSSREIQPAGHSSSQLNATDGGEASNAEEDLHLDNPAEGSGLEQGSGVDNTAGGQANPGSGETRRQRASINRKKKEFSESSLPLNFSSNTHA